MVGEVRTPTLSHDPGIFSLQYPSLYLHPYHSY